MVSIKTVTCNRLSDVSFPPKEQTSKISCCQCSDIVQLRGLQNGDTCLWPVLCARKFISLTTLITLAFVMFEKYITEKVKICLRLCSFFKNISGFAIYHDNVVVKNADKYNYFSFSTILFICYLSILLIKSNKIEIRAKYHAKFYANFMPCKLCEFKSIIKNIDINIHILKHMLRII